MWSPQEAKTPNAQQFPKILIGFVEAHRLPRGHPSKPSSKSQFVPKASEIHKWWSTSTVSLIATRDENECGTSGQRAGPGTTIPADLSTEDIRAVHAARLPKPRATFAPLRQRSSKQAQCAILRGRKVCVLVILQYAKGQKGVDKGDDLRLIHESVMEYGYDNTPIGGQKSRKKSNGEQNFGRAEHGGCIEWWGLTNESGTFGIDSDGKTKHWRSLWTHWLRPTGLGPLAKKSVGS